MRRDIDDALRGWPFDPKPETPLSREVRARDGRMVLQVRVELGIVQMEVEGRPDGTRPSNFLTYLDYMRHRAASRGLAPGGKGQSWKMDPEHCDEADREFIQYSHRRVAWLALGRYDKALLDADHTLSLMDFVARHGGDFDYVASHERFRGVVILHRTQALAAIAIDRRKSEEAIDVVHDGIDQLYSHQKSWREILRKMIEEDPESVDDEEDFGLVNLLYIEQLRRLGAEIRKNFGIEKTLREQLDEAVSQEDYERAARLRDMIRGRGESGRKAR